jgi:hypothetical protein
MGSVVCVRPRVEIEHKTLGMPTSDEEIQAVGMINLPRPFRNIASLIDVVEFKARKVRFV